MPRWKELQVEPGCKRFKVSNWYLTNIMWTLSYGTVLACDMSFGACSTKMRCSTSHWYSMGPRDVLV